MSVKQRMTSCIIDLAKSGNSRSKKLARVYENYLRALVCESFDENSLLRKELPEECWDDFRYIKTVLSTELFNEVNEKRNSNLAYLITPSEIIEDFHYTKSLKVIEKLINIYLRL